MLILVRHAMPAFGPQAPPHQWPLSEDGRTAATLLADILPKDSRLVASAEPKAWQTLEPAGQPERDPRFNEIWRTEPWGGNYRQRRREYVEGVDHPEWEPRAQVAERFGAAVAEHLAIADDRPLVVATHGMAMTVWLTARIGLSDPGTFWAELQFPDAHRVDLETGTIARAL
ncbi:Phosphoglycerate mutase [Catenulispora acidiphila DSM 44928]|uniref:Phosphoglycerate mutase n=1 Tax=Catenulispora acidiphila (strain DSM 44928 / JCM 14897 / NBRC 102108 / NRRL B-24433 / ID139908) TaxID=479433 RepID=C7Q1J2_CATAD|nr:phosphoglycerate mutase family protein [Catenulispora acidiphila]ACU73721.1 Phosphoglycerate mutase [Catenulispora acidiphila DSM 44928]